MAMSDTRQAAERLVIAWAKYRDHWNAGLNDFGPPPLIQLRRDIEAALSAAPATAFAEGRAEGQREAFRAGFLATVPDSKRGIPWSFDGPAAADREPEAWEAYQKLLTSAPAGEPRCRQCHQLKSSHCDLDDPGVDHSATCMKTHHEFKAAPVGEPPARTGGDHGQ